MRAKLNLQNQNNAVAYIRMSTDHQEFSPDIQRCFLQDYAEKNQLCIVREYIDAGKSGLNAENRPEFLSMIQRVQSGQEADFQHILVYDISRWGRFLNIDESGHYEQICTNEKIRVHYCAEPLLAGNDVGAQVFKVIKRWSAGN